MSSFTLSLYTLWLNTLSYDRMGEILIQERMAAIGSAMYVSRVISLMSRRCDSGQQAQAPSLSQMPKVIDRMATHNVPPFS